MVRITLEVEVAAPVDEVFRLFTDLEGAPERVSGILRLEKLTEGPVGKGTRFRETRKVFKREAAEEMEITAFEPGRMYALGCASCGCRYETVFRFRPEGDRTRVEMTTSARPVTVFARVLSPLGFFMTKAMGKILARDLEDLKAAAEAAHG